MKYKLTHRQFNEALKGDKLLGLECKHCGEMNVPPRKVCLACASEDLEVVELSGKGSVETFTVVRVPPEGREAPYVVGMVSLDEGPWVVCNILGLEPDQAKMDLIGRRVRLGHQVLPGDKFSGGEQVAMTFTLES